MELDDGLLVVPSITHRHKRNRRERTGQASCAGQSQLELECDQHGRLDPFPKGTPADAGAKSSVYLAGLVEISAGAFTWVIRSSFHLPSTLKWAVAPNSTASIRLWLT